ncbi:hypothetical protein ACI2EW_07800, partial [Campylobacter coli]
LARLRQEYNKNPIYRVLYLFIGFYRFVRTVDKFMSEMRAVGNLCGNSVAALIVAIWDKQIDWEKFRYALDNPEKFHNAGMH